MVVIEEVGVVEVVAEVVWEVVVVNDVVGEVVVSVVVVVKVVVVFDVLGDVVSVVVVPWINILNDNSVASCRDVVGVVVVVGVVRQFVTSIAGSHARWRDPGYCAWVRVPLAVRLSQGPWVKHILP